ncbi:MAG: response regulator transcription factor [Dorea sp.]|jgi:DNA-binding response OmpR family regulator|nr:response regulator transcription factor [Dorea sp.]MCI9452400.1 response regulator transcription factor [Dorea sp.]
MTKILAVDDDVQILKLIRNALAKEGYEVTVQSDPLELKKMKLTDYQLILLDVMMPKVDGFTLCEEIRGKVDCPILFLTAKTKEADIMRGLGIGGDDYITKPFGIGELRARVKAHLRRETREKKHVVSVNGVRFYLKEKKAYYSGKELGLTKSEYAICEYLALNRGQVFSKDRIYEHVFGYEKESDNSVITEHVKNIRAKGKKAGFEPIETVWGIGYRWR